MKKQFILVSMLLLSLIGFAQSTLTLKDAVLNGRKYFPQGLILTQWIPGSDSYSHVVDGYQSLAIVDAKSGEEIGRVSVGEINEALTDFETKIGNTWMLNWSEDGLNLHFTQKGHLFTYNVESKEAASLFSMAEGAKNVHLSSALNAAYTIDNNVYVNWSEDGSMQQVTFHEDANIVAGQAIARSEFGITEGLFWNESGDAIAFYEKNESAVSNYPLLDIQSTPGSLREIKYPMAGQGSEYARVGVLHKCKKKAVYLETDGI